MCIEVVNLLCTAFVRCCVVAQCLPFLSEFASWIPTLLELDGGCWRFDWSWLSPCPWAEASTVNVLGLNHRGFSWRSFLMVEIILAWFELPNQFRCTYNLHCLFLLHAYLGTILIMRTHSVRLIFNSWENRVIRRSNSSNWLYFLFLLSHLRCCTDNAVFPGTKLIVSAMVSLWIHW